MLVSCNWLQRCFKKELPPPEKLAEALTFSVFEVEGIERKGGDTLLDVKVLPDRACYALCHRGIAGEVAAALDVKMENPSHGSPKSEKLPPLSISIESGADCRRYIGRRVEGISNAPTPEQTRTLLASLGQRSINGVVDAANFVMYDCGQPLHAFDADKIKGGIVVRRAKGGEHITTLDNREVDLDGETLVIADDAGPLAIAGIKGGNRAEVGPTTKNLVLESASFNPTLIRKTSERLNIRTDASKRFENNLSPVVAEGAMREFSSRIAEIDSDATFGELVDVYPVPQETKTIGVSAEEISRALGISISAEAVIKILTRLGIEAVRLGNALEVRVPSVRRDLVFPEDLVEEVGRIYGYEKLPEAMPPEFDRKVSIPKRFYYEFRVREFLSRRGYSEIMTSSFDAKGDRAILKPLAADKAFLRTNLSEHLEASLALNLNNAPLLNVDPVSLFEIGSVFPKAGEHVSLCIGIAQSKGKKERVNDRIKDVRDELLAALGANVTIACTIDDTGGIILLANKPIGKTNHIDGVMELDFDALIAALPEPKECDIVLPPSGAKKFSPFSNFPFIVRDVAVFVPSGTDSGEVWKAIEKGINAEGKKLLVNHYLFDRFEKDGKVSYAFRLVFQSFERTLTDAEANAIMEGAAKALGENKDWTVR